MKLFCIVPLLFFVLICGCTQQTTEDEAESIIDNSGYTISTLSDGNLSLKWRVNNNSQLDASLIGDPGGKGWIAIGFGKSIMADAKIIVAQNGSDGTSISTAMGYNFGLNNSSVNLTNTNVVLNSTQITASFNVLLSDLNITLNSPTNIIWAYRTVDQGILSNLSNIGKHSSRGSTSIIFK